MADQILTPERLINGDKDLQTIEDFMKIKDETITTRFGDEIMTMSGLQEEVKKSGGYFKRYTSLAAANADLANIPVDAVVKVTSEADGGDYEKVSAEATSLTKSPHDPLTQAKNYTDSSFEIKINGGDLYYANTAKYTFDGYINATGEFVSSTAGYKTTDFIPIYPSKKLLVSVNASSSVAAVSFWDENKTFISAVKGNNNPAEVEITPPPNAKYIRSSSNLSVTPNAYTYAVFDPLLDDPSLIKTTSLGIEASANLAKPSLIIEGAYVNSVGTITTSAGWKYIKLPVTPGKTYTFGRFLIDSAGYYAFHTAENTNIAGSSGAFQNNSLPRTVTAPASAAYLLIDIARPTNTATQHAQLTVNEGSTLIDYVEPVDVVTKIAGYKLAGVSSGGSSPAPTGEYIEQNGNATLADIIADSITTGALIANLPTSSAGLETGQAYIDTATATIKVVM